MSIGNHVVDDVIVTLNMTALENILLLQNREGAMSNSSSSNSLNTTATSLGGRGVMTTSHGHGGGVGVSSSGYGHRSTYSLKSRQSSFTSSKEDLAEKRAAATLARKNSGIPVYSPIKSECKH